MKRIAFFLLLLALTAGMAPARGSAELQPADIALAMSDPVPKPGERITVTATSYGVDLSQAILTWTYGGKLVASGTARTTVAIIAPNAGDSALLSLTARGTDFADTTATLTIRPASVDILWEGADSYVPPFYRGRALPAPGGIIRVVAVPGASAPSGLTYRWSRNGAVLPQSSGFNQSTLLFKDNGFDRVDTIDLSVSGGPYAGGASTDITPVDPSLVAYLVSEGYVDYATGSTSTVNSRASGFVVHVAPYYFSTKRSFGNDLTIDFSLDGTTINASLHQNEVPLSRPEGGGQSVLRASVLTKDYSLQQATTDFTLNFN